MGCGPYLGGSINIDGKTSHGGAGLLWRTQDYKRVYGEGSFGLVVHNGTKSVPVVTESTTFGEILALQARERSEIEFGSRALFRSQFAIGYRWTETFSTEFTVEHLSNGKILGQDENEGVENIGVRFNRKF